MLEMDSRGTLDEPGIAYDDKIATTNIPSGLLLKYSPVLSE